MLGNPSSREALATLLSYRLPVQGSNRDIKQEWMDILEGKHHLWRGIDAEKRECVRGFLVQFHSDILHRSHRNFNFRGGSIGNFFLAAMQRFFRSIQSAIFLFSALTEISTLLPGCYVLPAINTNKTTTIAAALEDGTQLVGQCEISHPTADGSRTAPEPPSMPSTRRPSMELQDSVLGFSQINAHDAYLQRLQPDRQMHSQSLTTASSAHSMNDSDFSDDANDLNEEEDFEATDMGESLGNIVYGSKVNAQPLLSPIKRT